MSVGLGGRDGLEAVGLFPLNTSSSRGEVAVVVSWMDMVPGGTKAGKLHSYPVSARTWYEETLILA